MTDSLHHERRAAVCMSASIRQQRASALALMLSAGTPALAADEAGYVAPSVGTVNEYAGRLFGVDCVRWTIREVTADGSAVADCQGHRLSLDASGNPVAARGPDGRTLVEFKPAAPGLRFPLAVGAHWRQGYTAFTGFNNLVWDGEASCRVEAFEPVQVPAGEFEAFRIECQDKWMVGPKSGITHVTRWYAPTAGTVVRQVHREDPARWNFELLSTGTTAPAASPAVKIEAVPSAGPRPQYDPGAPDILDPDEY